MYHATMARRSGSPAANPSSPSSVPAAVETSDERSPRTARRKRETHEKLLSAAFRLFGERGVDAVAINEITEAADVGFGSFYNHFTSKEAIYGAVVDQVFGAFGDSLEALTRHIEDPAEVVATCVRHTILRAQAEPVWGGFLLREGFKPASMTRGLGLHLLRDVRRGAYSKRFHVHDVEAATLMVGGTVMAVVAAEVALATDGAAIAKVAGRRTKDLANRAAVMLLEALGLDRGEAQRIVKRPLPKPTGIEGET